MQAPTKPWESSSTGLQNSRQIPITPSITQSPTSRSIPVLPPRPQNTVSTLNSYSPYSSYGSSYGTGYGTGYGSMGYGYGSYSSPYRSSLYGNYGSYGGYGMYGGMTPFGGYNNVDDAERRFIQFAEERSRNTFSNIENVVRAVSSLSMMLDNTFFAITSSFRAVLSVAENFGRLRSVFGQIWYSVNIFRLFSWFYRKLLELIGKKPKGSSVAWSEAAGEAAKATGCGSNLSTLAFFGLLFSAPYFISKLLPKYEDKANPAAWKSPGIKAKAAFDFRATNSDELSFDVNDEITLAPTYIQEEMKLVNTGWAFAICKGRSGFVPLNYMLLSNVTAKSNGDVPIPRKPLKSSLKRVSFGENQIFTPDEPTYVESAGNGRGEVRTDGGEDKVKSPEVKGSVDEKVAVVGES